MISVVGCSGEGDGNGEGNDDVTIPSSPTELTCDVVSQTAVNLSWTDTSANENGFNIYRDGTLLATVGEDVTAYEDTNLQASTTYQYAVSAKNTAGESESCLRTATTLNPGIGVTLNSVGVLSDHDPYIKGAGELYLEVAVSDGVTTEITQVPAQTEGIDHYSLNDNETKSVEFEVFDTDAIGDYLLLAVVAYESDGEDGYEQLVYESLSLALQQYITTQTGGIDVIDLLNINLTDLISDFLGAEDDFIGAYEATWNKEDSWGIGSYEDVTVDDLRLWFTISND